MFYIRIGYINIVSTYIDNVTDTVYHRGRFVSRVFLVINDKNTKGPQSKKEYQASKNS